MRPFLDAMGAASFGVQVRVAFAQSWEKGSMAAQNQTKSQAASRIRVVRARACARAGLSASV
jgi:hypothetical protein